MGLENRFFGINTLKNIVKIYEEKIKFTFYCEILFTKYLIHIVKPLMLSKLKENFENKKIHDNLDNP